MRTQKHIHSRTKGLEFYKSHLKLSASEKTFIQSHCQNNGILVGKFNVSEALRMAVELIALDGDSIDSPTPVKMLLQLLGCGSVVNLQ